MKTKLAYLKSKIAFVLLLIALSPNALACQGEDYNRAMNILNQSLQLGMEIGMTGDLNRYLRKLNELSIAAQQLPPSCQYLLQSMGGAYAGAGSGSGTNCMGGVCCDSSGCY